MFPVLSPQCSCSTFLFTKLLSSAYSTLSFSFVLFCFCRNSFLFLSKLSIYVSSMLLLVDEFCVLFCVVSIDSLRILFIISIDGSPSVFQGVKSVF